MTKHVHSCIERYPSNSSISSPMASPGIFLRVHTHIYIREMSIQAWIVVLAVVSTDISATVNEEHNAVVEVVKMRR